MISVKLSEVNVGILFTDSDIEQAYTLNDELGGRCTMIINGKRPTENTLEEAQKIKMANANMAKGSLRMLNKLSFQTNQSFPIVHLECDCKLAGGINLDAPLEYPDDADMVYLGISACGMTKHGGPTGVRVSENLWRVENMLSTHAFMICSERGLELAKHVFSRAYNDIEPGDERYIFNDQYFTLFQPAYKVYALNSPVFYQTSKNYESLTNIALDQCMRPGLKLTGDF